MGEEEGTLGTLLRRLSYFLRRRRFETELAEEIELHRAARFEQLAACGLESDKAAAAAARALGNTTLAREDARNIWISGALDQTWQDLRYAVRTLTRSPGFALVALFTLALGIGANTAMFSVVNAVLLRPLPYADPDRVVMVWTAGAARNIHEAPTSFPTFTDWRDQGHSFADMAYWRPRVGTMTGVAEPERLEGVMASANLFSLLGVAPAIGRTFTAEDERARQQVAVISQQLWKRRFGSNPRAIGQLLEIDGHRLEIIGVMPEGFYFPTKNVQHWVPASLYGPWSPKPAVAERSWTNRFADLWSVVGRLKPGVRLQAAQAEMTAIGSRLTAAHRQSDPDFPGFGVEVVPILDQLTGRALRLGLWILLGAVAFVLLIACANVAHLVLARGSARTREMAVRTALGAARGRLMRQLFIEHSLLALVAAVVGTGAALASIRLAASSLASGIPRLDELTIDFRVLAFTAILTVISSVLFGLAPAWRLSHGNPSEALKDGTRGAGSSGGPLRAALVVLECTLAVALLAGAGLLIRSFLLVRSVDPGFEGQNVFLVRVNLPIPVSPTWRQQEWQTFAEIETRLSGLPGVQRVGAITNFLITRNPEEAVTVEGQTSRPEGPDSTLVSTDDVTPGFFQAMGVPLLSGRFFRYDEQNAPITIVNQAFAHHFFPGRDPVGRRFKEGAPGSRDAWITIIGVVGDMHRQGLEHEPQPEFFFPSSEPTMDIAVRTIGDPSSVSSRLRDTIRSVYSGTMIVRMVTVEESFGEFSAQRRFQTWLLSLFAGTALVLSAVGIYGILHFTVAQRMHEFGVRLALGASNRQLLGYVLGSAMRLPLMGVALGLGIAIGLTRLLGHLLFRVSATDPATFGGVALILLAVALVACWIPARRASQVDPIVALRGE
jgi:putative ABC transport system permease protein